MLVVLFESIPWLAAVALCAHLLCLWPGRLPWLSERERLKWWASTWFAPSWAAASLLGHFFLTRCPVLCLGCAGDFYHELNVGLPWQGRCQPYDVVFSVASLIFGLVGLAVGLAARVGGPPDAGLLPQLVWYFGSATALRRSALGLALGLGWWPQLFSGAVAHCAAASRAGGSQHIAVISAFDHYNDGMDITSCIRSQQQSFATQHGYDLVRPSSCEDFWREHQRLLPEMSGRVSARLAEGKFDMSCKLAYVLATLAERPALGWALWLDEDAVITNPGRSIEELIPAEEVDFVLAMGAEAGGELPLPAGAWHALLPQVPSWSTTAGHFNGGVFLVRNSPRARAVLQRALELVNTGRDEDNDQRALFDALREPLVPVPAAAARSPAAALQRSALGDQVVLAAGFEDSLSVQGDVVRLPSAALRVVSPRCLNVHPSSWAPWNRWLPGDFIAHNWGGNKRLMLLEVCVAGSENEATVREYTERVALLSGALGAAGACAVLACLLCCVAGGRRPSPSAVGFKEPSWCRYKGAQPAHGYVRGREMSRCG